MVTYAGVILGGPQGCFPLVRKVSWNKEIRALMPSKIPTEVSRSVMGDRAKTILHDLFTGVETRK